MADEDQEEDEDKDEDENVDKKRVLQSTYENVDEDEGYIQETQSSTDKKWHMRNNQNVQNLHEILNEKAARKRKRKRC